MPPRAPDKELLRTLTPLNGLKPENIADLANKTMIQDLGAGRYLFKQGETDKRTIYLISGEVELRVGDTVMRVIKGGTEESKHPLAPQSPRTVSARAKTDIEFLPVDSDLLDIMLTWDQTGAFEVGELQNEEGGGDDWRAESVAASSADDAPTSFA